MVRYLVRYPGEWSAAVRISTGDRQIRLHGGVFAPRSRASAESRGIGETIRGSASMPGSSSQAHFTSRGAVSRSRIDVENDPRFDSLP